MTLLAQVKQGDTVGWKRLMDLYRPLVLHWCQRKVPQREDAEDVVQEAFTTVWSKIDEFNRQHKGSFRAWIKKITKYKILEYWKRAGHEPPAAGGSVAQEHIAAMPAQSTEDGQEDEEERAILYQRGLELIRGRFELTTWEAFWQTGVVGRPPKDVAADLGISVAAIYTARSRVLAELRQMLDDLLD
jgi:RNA polymerase sigma-70 factor (ECF subfamily)